MRYPKKSGNHGPFGMTAPAGVAFLIHIGLTSIYFICYLLSYLKFATCDACCNLVLLEIQTEEERSKKNSISKFLYY